MNNSKKLKTFNVKKDKKLQGKKRKLEAFLNLVRQDELTPVPKKKKSNNTFQENYKALKDELKKYQKAKSGDPSFCLKEDGRCAIVNFSDSEIPNCTLPLFLDDIYNLLLTSVLGNLSPFPLRWAALKSAQSVSKTVVIEIEGFSQQDLKEMHSELNKNDIFPFIVEIVSSDIPFAIDLSTMHLTTTSYSLNKGCYSSMFPMAEPALEETLKPVGTPEYKFSKLHLLLNSIQLAMEHYPLPRSVFEQSQSAGYLFSKDAYTEVHDNSPMFAVDCEMCMTTSKRNEVTRVAIVNENLETIYHTLVKPKEEIVDYATRFSGITEGMLKNVKTTLDDVQKDIRRILPSDAILCGQSLNCDLHSLKMMHPYVIDTSIIFNEHGVRYKKPSLKQLAKIHLKETIQNNKAGHSPIEDAIATMRLVQLKLKNSIKYGDAVLAEPSGQNDEATNKDENNASISVTDPKCKFLDPLKAELTHDKENGFFSRLSRFTKKACLIGSENSLNNYCEEVMTDHVNKVTISETEKVLKAVADNIENNDLIISHLLLETGKFSVKELKEEIMQTYATFPKKTVVIILMSGVKKHSNEKFKYSYCMLNVKK